MSSIHKLPGRRNWYCMYRTADGKQHCQSTGTTDKAQAEDVCAAISRSVAMSRRGQLTEERARDIISSAVRDVLAAVGENLKSAVTKKFLDTWLKAKEVETTPKTLARYKTAVKHFLAFVGPKADKDLTHLTKSDFSGFKQHLATTLSHGSMSANLKIVKAALNTAVQEGLLTANPANIVSTRQGRRSGAKESARRPFTLEQLKKILSVADAEWKGMILMGVYTGLRLGDVAELTWNDIDLQHREILYYMNKKRRNHVVAIAAPLQKYLESIPCSDDPSTPLFPEAYAARERSPHGGTLSNRFARILVSAGLKEAQPHVGTGKGRSGKRAPSVLSFHSLRHTATTMLKRAGASDAVAQDIVGHDSVAVSRLYTHLDTATKLAALDKLPDVTA